MFVSAVQVPLPNSCEAVPAGVVTGSDAEHRETPEQPGDVVDEDVTAAEEDRRAEDGVAEPRLAQRALVLGLAAEVRERRIERRVRDGDVNDALDAGLRRGAEERAHVLDGAGERRANAEDPVERRAGPCDAGRGEDVSMRRIVAVALAVTGASCGTGSDSNAVPAIRALAPSSADAGGPAFTLTISGANFPADARVEWNGSPRATTYVSGSELRAAIAASDLTGPGLATVAVAAPGLGQAAARAWFTIRHVQPALGQDYSANFTGWWSVTGTVRMGSQTDGSYGDQEVTRSEQNVLLFQGACDANTPLRAVVTSTTTFEFDSMVCTQAEACGPVTVTFATGTGQMAEGTLSARLRGTASGCGQDLPFEFSFSGPIAGGFATTGALATGRNCHTATSLAAGQVLIAGGFWGADWVATEELASAAIYDPSLGTFIATGSMTTGRVNHTATLLPNGQVLIAGGQHPEYSALASAELYDPGTRTFTTTGSMTHARYGHTATLLPSGLVLVAGGYGDPGASQNAELFDPATGTFAAAGSTGTGRYNHTATLLQSGEVLLAGGQAVQAGWGGSSAEVYDPVAGTFVRTGNLTASRYLHSATLLRSGRVLIAGGYDSSPLDSAEQYDPGTGTFTATGSMTTVRAAHTATLQPSGVVLVAGGTDSTVSLSSAELYEPAVGTFVSTGSMSTRRAWQTATLLPNGDTLLAGGLTNGVSPFLASAELFQRRSPSTPGAGSILSSFVERRSTLARAYSSRLKATSASP